MIALKNGPYTSGPYPFPPGKAHLEDHNDCWMCSGFNVRAGKKLLNRKRSGIKCKNCSKHVHSRYSADDDVCVACRDGNYIYMTVRESD